jgi:hypothetical protein
VNTLNQQQRILHYLRKLDGVPATRLAGLIPDLEPKGTFDLEQHASKITPPVFVSLIQAASHECQNPARIQNLVGMYVLEGQSCQEIALTVKSNLKKITDLVVRDGPKLVHSINNPNVVPPNYDYSNWKKERTPQAQLAARIRNFTYSLVGCPIARLSVLLPNIKPNNGSIFTKDHALQVSAEDFEVLARLGVKENSQSNRDYRILQMLVLEGLPKKEVAQRANLTISGVTQIENKAYRCLRGAAWD